jgi:hypothetical protein
LTVLQTTDLHSDRASFFVAVNQIEHDAENKRILARARPRAGDAE